MKLPEPFLDLFRDLRDRRMLSIALVLVAAIVAVPFLLGGSSEETTPPPTTAAATTAPFAGEEQLDPVVLAETPELRDFRERLADYPSHNPFKQSPAPGSQSGSGTNGTTTGTGTTGTTGTTTGTGTTGTSTDTGVPSTNGVSSASTDTGANTPPATEIPTVPDTGDTTTPDTTPDDGITPTTPLYTLSYWIDVRIGPVGDTKVIKDAKQLDFLPDAKDPLVEYVDANETGTQVVFIVNPAATEPKGQGECIGKGEGSCQYLVMNPKDTKYFTFDGAKYRIQLMAINEHREPYHPAGKEDAGSKSGSKSDSSDDGSDDGGPSSRSVNFLPGT